MLEGYLRLFAIFVATIACGLIVFDFWERKRRNANGPFNFPILGTLTRTGGNITFADLKGQFDTYGETYFFKRFGQGVFRTRDPEIARFMCVTQFQHFLRSFQNPNQLSVKLKDMLFGDGIFGADGDTWQLQRKLAIPLFKKHSLDSMKAVFHDKATIVMDILGQHAANKKPVEVSSLFFRYTLDSFGVIGFGFEIDSLRRDDVLFPLHFDRAQRVFVELLSTPLDRQHNQKLQDFYESSAYLNNFFDQTITAKENEDKENATDLLSKFSLLKDDNNQPITVKWLREILINFAIAGRDTTAMLINWTLYMLMTQPHVYDKLQREVDAMPEDGDVNELSYLEILLKETLRFMPSVPQVARGVDIDMELPNGMKMVKGDRMSYSIIAIHRNEKFWDRPDVFDPERWLDSGILKNTFQYLPFHMGKQQCLGMHMAQIEAKIILVRMIKTFKFSLAPGQNVKPFIGIILIPDNGIQVHVERR